MAEFSVGNLSVDVGPTVVTLTLRHRLAGLPCSVLARPEAYKLIDRLQQALDAKPRVVVDAGDDLA